MAHSKKEKILNNILILNIKMFTNLLTLQDDPGDKIL